MLNDLFAYHLPTLHGFMVTWVTLHGLVVMLGLAIYAFGSHTLRQRRHPSAGIAWIIALVLMPYVALPLYLMFGSRKLVGSRRVHTATASQEEIRRSGKQGAAQLAAAIGLPPAAAYTDLAIHEDGQQALAALRSMLRDATQSLDVCSFLLGSDALGNEIAQLLMRRARAGVRVRLMIDGVGTYLGGRPDFKELAAAGVQVTLFVSPWRSALRGRTNLRNHRKMVIVDGVWMWCGGRNLASEYFEGEAGGRARGAVWTDLSFDLRGPLAVQGQQRFDRDWAFASGGKAASSSTRAPIALSAPVPVAMPQPDAASDNGLTHGMARMVPSGPDQAEDTIYTLLVSGCFTAQQRILAVTPYFVPDPTLLMALTLAARRGVAVDLLLPRRSNHLLADIARYSALRELATAGARVWLAPGMVHAKAIVIDEDLALVGSANLDGRSLFLNYELMVAFYDMPVVQQFGRWVDSQRRTATRYEPRAPGLPRELLEGMVRWVAFQL